MYVSTPLQVAILMAIVVFGVVSCKPSEIIVYEDQFGNVEEVDVIEGCEDVCICNLDRPLNQEELGLREQCKCCKPPVTEKVQGCNDFCYNCNPFGEMTPEVVQLRQQCNCCSPVIYSEAQAVAASKTKIKIGKIRDD